MKQTQQKVENTTTTKKNFKTNMSLSKARKMRESPNSNESLAENFLLHKNTFVSKTLSNVPIKSEVNPPPP